MFSLNSSFGARLGKISLCSFAVAIALAFTSQTFAEPGDLFVSDLSTNSIVVYKPDGSSSTFASGLNSPQGLAFDQDGNLYVADAGSGNIYKYDGEGNQSTFASGLSNPIGLAFGGADLMVAQNGANEVTSYTLDGLVRASLAVTAPIDVKVGGATRYISNGVSVLRIEPDGTMTDIDPGDGSRGVDTLLAEHVMPAQYFTFVSTDAGEVKKILPTGGVSTFTTGLNDPHGVAFRPARFSGDTDRVGSLYVADSLGGFIFQITPDGVKTTFASQARPNYLVFQGLQQQTPTPTPSPTVSPSPSTSPSPSASPSPSPSASPSPSVSPTPLPTPGLLQNISTRGDVLTDDKVLIGGFIITGGTTEKTVVIRAIGPSLSAFGLQNVLANPVLELHLPDGTVVTNNDWLDNSSSDQAALIAAGLAPTNDLESAILIHLPPVDDSVPGSGLYTAIVRGNDGGTGVGLVEVYDLDNTTTTVSQLANISTRGFAGTEDNVLIGGFISGPGSDDGKVLMRAIGTSLTGAGVSGALQNPTLELFDENGDSLAFNDDWQDTAGDEILATGLAPSNDAESAILAAQLAGRYTIIVRGVDNSTGVALVEAYHLPSPSAAR